MMQCHVCGDNANGKSCDLRSIYTGNLQQCGQGEDFCMTDLIHDGQAYPKIYKRLYVLFYKKKRTKTHNIWLCILFSCCVNRQMSNISVHNKVHSEMCLIIKSTLTCLVDFMFVFPYAVLVSLMPLF